MSERRNSIRCPILRRRGAACQDASLELIEEEPLQIRIDGEPYTVVMRTPGEELFHAAGFCLAEGIVDSPEDFAAVGYCESMDPNVIEVRLRSERRSRVQELLRRHVFVSQTSCGICGKKMIDDLCQEVRPIQSDFTVDLAGAVASLHRLTEVQQHYRTTRCSHASLVLDGRLDVLALAEDVGRHNALDKAVGKVMMAGTLGQARVLVLSSRISYELVQKAARARIPIMLSYSRPTALAVQMGRALNLTLAFPDGEAELVIVCGEQRIRP